MTRLEVRGLSVAYGNAIALEGIDLTVEPGSVVSILGANGAGKSSFLKCLMGLVPARSGSIRLDGVDITGIKPHESALHGMAMSPEGRRLFPELTVHENLCMGGYLRRRDARFRSDLEQVFGYFPRLRDRAQQLAGRLSGGEQQMVAIGRALMSRPRLLLLDEPSLGLAPVIIAQLASIVTAIHREGMTIILVEQNARMALKLSDYGFVFETGRLALEGTSAELLRNPDVVDIYMGDGAAGRSAPVLGGPVSGGQA
ncbi:leucine/isoleucine/valine transporter subunit; ATP-binding component of ABC superfamily [Burkholderiales bacterium 8X]|nr:leucine/isoleucine/valine transporter subunit; ATP-binding component of ABC superfamily [Burkholderiales bacterium 8X]